MRFRIGYILILFFFIVTGLTLEAKNIHIGPGKEFRSIRPALLTAADGDSVFVYHSLYKEGNIIINKKIVMLGINNPVIDGDKKYEVVSIRSDNVVFKGFTVQNSGYGTLNDLGGIKVYDAQNIVIETF